MPANGPVLPQTKSLALAMEAKENSSELNERRTNVYENKGSLWKTRCQSANVYENKDS
jgi:hypothetical protein